MLKFNYLKKIKFSLVRCHSTCKSQEVKIPVPWGVIAGKWWGSENQRPILCLHGWQDNCGTFDRLIPLLHKRASFLAIDLPGHGRSSYLPDGFYYHRMTYLILIRYLVDFFKWKKVSLMGHSMGGMISYVYTMIFSNAVDLTICLDGAKPIIVPDNLSGMARKIENFIKHDNLNNTKSEPPSYTMEQILDKISKVQNSSIDRKYGHHIAERNISPSKIFPGRFYFSRDMRVKSEELLNWDHRELVKYAKNIVNPLLVIKASKSPYYDSKEQFSEVMSAIENVNKKFNLYEVEGSPTPLLGNANWSHLILAVFCMVIDLKQ